MDLALPTWAFEVLPFALGLPAHVVGVGHEVHGSESSAEAADVPAELISAFRHHNKLDLELFRHAETLFWKRVKRQAAKVQGDLTSSLALSQTQTLRRPKQPPPQSAAEAMADMTASSADRSGPYDASLAPAALMLSATTAKGGDGAYDGTGPYDASLDQKTASLPDPVPKVTGGYPAEASEDPDPTGPEPIPCTGGFCGVKDKAVAPGPSPAPAPAPAPSPSPSSSSRDSSGDSSGDAAGDAAGDSGDSAPAVGGPIPANTALELCPAADFAESLVALSPLLPGAVARAGGAKRLTERYARKFGQGACPLASAATGWPPSNRSTPLLLNMAEGSTGTRFLECLLSQRMRTAHFPDTALAQALDQTSDAPADAGAAATAGATAAAPNDLTDLPLHECTRSEGERSCTGGFDAFDYVSDTPTAQLVSLLLETHAKKNQVRVRVRVRVRVDACQEESGTMVNPYP